QGGVEIEYLLNESYVLVECMDCGLIYQGCIPNNFLMTKLYEQWIDPEKAFDLESARQGIEYYSFLVRGIKRSIRHFGLKANELDYLDFGMGWGDWCRMAKAYGCSVYGTELSQVRINYAKASGISVIGWEEIPQYQFDFINTEQVFEHIGHPLE